MTAWPKDNMAAKIAFYGDPRGPAGENPQWRAFVETRITPPFQMFYAGKPIKSIAVHKKIADATMAAFNEIWEACAHDQKKVDATGASDFAGCFNYRTIADSDNLSNHSWGCAIDLSPKTNGFNTGKGSISNIVVDAFKRQGAFWGGDYKGRTDPMHFEFVDRGQATTVAVSSPSVPAPPAGITADMRARMARKIIDYEARRDASGNLAVFKPGDGSFEVAGLNSAHHRTEAARLRTLVEMKNFAEAEAYAASFILNYTKVATGWTTEAGCEFMLRDCVYNRGPVGGAKILQIALGFVGASIDGQIGQQTRARISAAKPAELLTQLRSARELYERTELKRNESDPRWKGLLSRWNNSLRDAKAFQEEGKQPAGGGAAKKTTTAGVATGTLVAAATVAKKPPEKGGGFDWWLLLPILVVGASIALVTWFVWPNKDAEKAA